MRYRDAVEALLAAAGDPPLTGEEWAEIVISLGQKPTPVAAVAWLRAMRRINGAVTPPPRDPGIPEDY